MNAMINQQFLLSVQGYSNEKLDLTLALAIQAPDEQQFKARLRLLCRLEVEPDLCIKDAYIEYLGIDVENNTLLPDNEMDFYHAHRRYKIDTYSQTAKLLAQQVDDYITDLIERIDFRIVITPEAQTC